MPKSKTDHTTASMLSETTRLVAPALRLSVKVRGYTRMITLDGHGRAFSRYIKVSLRSSQHVTNKNSSTERLVSFA